MMLILLWSLLLINLLNTFLLLTVAVFLGKSGIPEVKPPPGDQPKPRRPEGGLMDITTSQP